MKEIYFEDYEIGEKRDHKKPEFGLVNERLSVTNQKNETVLVADHLLLVKRKTE